MSRSTSFILMGSIWTLSTVLIAVGLHIPEPVLLGAGWMLAIVVFLSTCTALLAAVHRSPFIRSVAFISHLLTPLAWALWVATMENTAFSFSTWGLVSLMALVGSTLGEHGLEMEFDSEYGGETALEKALERAATPILGGGTPTLDTGSMKLPTL